MTTDRNRPGPAALSSPQMRTQEPEGGSADAEGRVKRAIRRCGKEARVTWFLLTARDRVTAELLYPPTIPLEVYSHTPRAISAARPRTALS